MVVALGTAMVLVPGESAAAPPVPSFTAPPEGYAAYDPQDTCDPTAKPGVVEFRDLVLAEYPSTGDFGISRACNVGGTSEHKEGRAWDWRVSASSQAGIAGDLLNWLLATRDGHAHALARRLGVMYIIWNRRIWSAYRAGEGWRPYSGSNPHTDHVHFSFSWAGARKQTTWWTARGSSLPPRPLCYPVSGDWDGNGSVTLGVACKNGHGMSWDLMNFNGGGSPQIRGGFGNSDWCLPVTGDWDGNGTTTIGVACKAGTNGLRWKLINGWSGSPSHDFGFGNSNQCWPVTGDWNGDGVDTVGVACKEGHGLRWYLMNFHGGGSPQIRGGFGNSDWCHPVTGDWDGNGTTTIGVACKSGHGMSWDLINGWSGSPSHEFGFGNSDVCRPVTGDWNADGVTTIGVACRSGATGLKWNMMNVHAGGSPQIEAGFGNGSYYQPTGGWGGPSWPGWPTG